MSDLNFFSEYIQQSKKAFKKTAVVYAIVALVLLSIIGSYVVTQLKVNAIEAETALMNDYLNDPATIKQLKEIEDLKQKLKILSEYGAQLSAGQNSINKADVIKSELLEKIESILPKDVIMSSLAYTQSNIAIQGMADARVPLAELSYNLYDLGLFTEVHVSKISNEAEAADRYQFEVVCALKEVISP